MGHYYNHHLILVIFALVSRGALGQPLNSDGMAQQQEQQRHDSKVGSSAVSEKDPR